jgi:hypothetical protein
MLRRPRVARPQAGPSCFYLGGVAAPIRHTEAIRHAIAPSDLHCGGVADVADFQEEGRRRTPVQRRLSAGIRTRIAARRDVLPWP